MTKRISYLTEVQAVAQVRLLQYYSNYNLVLCVWAQMNVYSCYLSYSFPVHTFVENGVIKSQRVHDVLLTTDRAHYIKYFPYMDSPQSIGKKCH